MKYTLPWPPSTNNAYAAVNGRKIKSKTARAYAADVEHSMYGQDLDCDWLHNARLAVTLDLYPPNRRAFDIANREKLAVDACFKVLGLDDASIDWLLIERHEPEPHGRIVLTVVPL